MLAIEIHQGRGFPFPTTFFTILVLIALASMVVWLVALVDALPIDERAWTAARQGRLVWVLVIVVLGILGAILYAAIGRPALRQVRV